MPKAYFIARVEITDPDKYARYAALATEAIKKHGGRPLVRGGPMKVMEGEGRPRNVVIEFDSMEAAERYYNSPDYQAAKAERAGAAIADMVIVEGAA